MEITIDDIKYFKLSPSLIALLKCIHEKDNSFLIELNSVADVFVMAKHLETKNLVKIIGDELSYESFELRRLDTIDYLNSDNSNDIKKKQIDEVITYFKEVTGEKYLDQALKSKAFRKTVSGRLSEGYSVDDLKLVIKVMNDKWKNDSYMKDFIRIETLLGAKKFGGYVNIANREINISKDFNDDI